MTKPSATLTLFSLTLFLSAAAMFSLQPMVGKMLLPLVGGAPSGWMVAMAFFQVMLLGGYLMAHAFARATPRMHAALYLGAMALGTLFLPVHLPRTTDITPGAGGVFLLLAGALAAPFIALSATSSTVQRLFMTTGHKTAKDPYFLYAASNLGSFAGLLLYPFAIEPFMTVSAQTRAWSCAYAALMALGAGCLWLSGKGHAPVKSEKAHTPPQRRMMWLALGFFPSSLLLGVTATITTDVISAPMVWVVPLALYLLAFVAAFSRKPPVTLAQAEHALPYAMAAAIIALMFQPPTGSLGFAGMFLHLAAFAVVALYCDLRLVALRPTAPGALTEFYLLLAAGGALGGVFNSLVAPHVFSRTIEYPLVLLALAFLYPGNDLRSRNGRIIAGLLALTLLLSQVNIPLQDMSFENISTIRRIVSIALAALAVVLSDTGRKIFFPALAVIFIIAEFFAPNGALLARERNFFGTIRVFEMAADTGEKIRYLMHGTTAHGFQVLNSPLQDQPQSYYSVRGPVGQIRSAYAPRKIGVIGLGTGAMNCPAAPGRSYTFFEIDPAVVDVAQRLFTYLGDCKGAAPPRIVLGDARLELEKMKNEKFDALFLDAFSSDAIPTHLLTREAFETYLAHLGKNGIMAVHISNRYFDLSHAVAAAAQAAGLEARLLKYKPDKNIEPFALANIWVAMGRPGTLNRLSSGLPIDPASAPWTDDYTNLLSTLEIFHAKTH